MKNAIETIGLTGNIATGKSVVRRMLSNCGALGIDADVIAHRMLYPGAPAYQPVVETFGEKILLLNRQISRKKLGEIVFNDPKKLADLESLVHPAVTRAIQLHIRQSTAPIVVIEAIKLLESDLKEICDSIWVVHASVPHQMERLLQTRKMTKTEARLRITSQPPQSEKLKLAEVVINTEGAYEQTWQQIQTALNDTIKLTPDLASLNFYNQNGSTLSVGSRAHFDMVLDFWQNHTDPTTQNFYQTLGFQMVLTFGSADRVRGIVIWDNWNFTAALSGTIFENSSGELTTQIFDTFISHAKHKQCEIALLPRKFVEAFSLQPTEYGFQYLPIKELPYPAWQQASDKIISGQEDKVWVKILHQPLEIYSKV